MVVRDVGGRRTRGWSPVDAWELWLAPGDAGRWDSTSMTDVSRRIAELLSESLCADDAEASGIRAKELVGDPDRAVALLGSPHVEPTARHAVVQRFGGVGALFVVACEELWRRDEESSCPTSTSQAGGDPAREERQGLLETLLRNFNEMGAEDIEGLVEAVEVSEGGWPGGESATARRWLHVTYAVAARDGTDEAHHAYVQALDKVLALKRELVAI